ncbi:hypothetical protein A0H81_06459 [Grifola frondosa]|uniref:BRCT domain-containing protein n=1 Tax=Grifola frondosa TaxID=5627 RepID=A0A1C7MAA2_GRIFR|nr:hypothetical protein A0H81_06459 [Grifola frondosa]
MRLFSGNACFSPSVPMSIKQKWAAHGGIVAQSQSERSTAKYFFCNGLDDPWFKFLSQKIPIAVFHASWISTVVSSNFPIPICRYVLDDSYCDPVPAAEHRISFMNRTPEQTPPNIAVRPLKRPLDIEDEPQVDCRPRKRARITNPRKNIWETPVASSSTKPITAEGSDRIPYLDLRKLYATFKKRRPDVLIFEKISTDQSLLLKSPSFSELLSNSVCSPPRISVSAALHALRDVSTSGIAKFSPGYQHLEKNFYCGYAE